MVFRKSVIFVIGNSVFSGIGIALTIFGLPVAIRQGRRHRRRQHLKHFQITSKLKYPHKARISTRPTCGILIFLNVSTAKCWRPPMLMAPSSHASRLQPPTHKSDVGHTFKQSFPVNLTKGQHEISMSLIIKDTLT